MHVEDPQTRLGPRAMTMSGVAIYTKNNEKLKGKQVCGGRAQGTNVENARWQLVSWGWISSSMGAAVLIKLGYWFILPGP